MSQYKTILIVDDSKTFQRIIEHILAPHFKIIGKGSSGIEGFDLYKRLCPDLVLMDITMPNCDGKECLKNIIRFDANANVIMVSGIGDEKTVNECIALGAKGFVNKGDISQENLTESILIKTVMETISQFSAKKVA